MSRRPPQQPDPGPDEVRDALEAALSQHFGRPRRVVRLDRRRSEYSTSFTLQELDVTIDGGEALALVMKDLGWRSLLGAARDVRPRFLYNPRREFAVYRHLLAGRGLGTAECYGAAVNEPADRHWLFLERVPAAKLCHVGDFAAWEQAARWLARFHAALAPAASRVDPGAGDPVPLLRYDAGYYRRWAERAAAFVARKSAGTSARRARFARLVGRYGRVADRLAALAATVIHGEFYATNILLGDDNGGGGPTGRPRICPVDWELAAIGPGLIDLAALTAGNWTPDRQAAMVAAYRDEAATSDGPSRPPPAAADERSEALDYCRLHLAVQWLGWAEDWSAPADQARDWLGDALAVAGRLDLG